MRAQLVGGFLARVPSLTPAKVVALLAAMLGVVVALGLVAPAASAATFSNNTPITINTSNEDCPGAAATAPAKATPYPSEIAVSGLGSSISDVNVTVSGLSHTSPDDVGLLLVSPAGQSTLLMTDSGGFAAVSGINLTFDDAASGFLPNGPFLSSGTYKPSVGATTVGCLPPGSFPDAPLGPYSSSLSVFNATNPNGTWKLYVLDDSRGDAGSISGWGLDISEPDTMAPSVTIDQASGQADPTTDSPIHFTAVFNEPVTDFTDSDVTLSGTAGATTALVSEAAPNDGTTYDVAVSGMTTSGTVIASILANAAQDAAQNGNSASTSKDNTVDFKLPDTQAPRVERTFPRNGGEVDPAASIRATFSEEMESASVKDAFKLFKKGSTNQIAAAVTYDAATDIATLNPTNNLRKGATYKAVVSTVAEDVAGNGLDQNSSKAGLQQKVWYFEID